MKIYTLPIEMVNALRSWFHPKDRSVIMAPSTFIEGAEIATPATPSIGRGRLYWKNNFWTQLNSSGVEQQLSGPALISETTLSGSAASVTFSGIPQIFRHLMLMSQARTDAVAETDVVLLRANGDTGPSYDAQVLSVNNATLTGAVGRAGTFFGIGRAEGASSRASNFAPTQVWIYAYSLSDREKWLYGLSANFGDASADADLREEWRSGRWRNTTPISSITLLPNTGPNFVSGSRFQLYGVN